jgi:hypothetical protein
MNNRKFKNKKRIENKVVPLQNATGKFKLTMKEIPRRQDLPDNSYLLYKYFIRQISHERNV